jgi:hypothetical protein
MERHITKPSINILVGMPESGKTNLMKKIIKDLFLSKQIHYVIVFCSEAIKEAYNWLPQCFVYTEFSLKLMYKIVLQQNEYNKGTDPNNPDDIPKRTKCAVIFDDIGGYESDFKKQAMVKIITEYRLSSFYFFIAIQYVRMVPPKVFACAFYYWLFAQDSEAEYNGCWSYCGQGMKKDAFMKFLDTKTKDKNNSNILNGNTEKYRYVLLYDKQNPADKYKSIKWSRQIGYKIEF